MHSASTEGTIICAGFNLEHVLESLHLTAGCIVRRQRHRPTQFETDHIPPLVVISKHCVRGGSATQGVAPGLDRIDAPANSCRAELDRFREGLLGSHLVDRAP